MAASPSNPQAVKRLWFYSLRSAFYSPSAHSSLWSSELRPEPSDAISSSFLKTRSCGGVITGLYSVLNSQTIGYTFTRGHEITLHSEHA